MFSTMIYKEAGDKLVGLFSSESKRAQAEGKKCHIKTMTSGKADKTIRCIPFMCHSVRAMCAVMVIR